VAILDLSSYICSEEGAVSKLFNSEASKAIKPFYGSSDLNYAVNQVCRLDVVDIKFKALSFLITASFIGIHYVSTRTYRAVISLRASYFGKYFGHENTSVSKLEPISTINSELASIPFARQNLWQDRRQLGQLHGDRGVRHSCTQTSNLSSLFKYSHLSAQLWIIPSTLASYYFRTEFPSSSTLFG
jgi:hypothetical protein